MKLLQSFAFLLVFLANQQLVNDGLTDQNSLFYKYQDLQSLDLKITELLERFHQMFKATEPLKIFYTKNVKHPFRVSGSLREGSFSSNLVVDSHLKLIPSIDLDIEILSRDNIDKAHRHCIVETNKAGFVHVKSTDADKTFFTHFFESNFINRELFNVKRYLQTNKLKRMLKESIGKKQLELLFFILFDISLERVNIGQKRRVTKSTCEYTNNIYIDKELKLIAYVDLAILIKLEWPCHYIKMWKERERLWPDLNLLAEELSVSYLIAKTTREERSNSEATEFKYSFSHIEHKIFSLFSTNQRTVYYTAKVIFKLRIKPLSDVFFTSFLVKNALLWICENHIPNDELWDFDNDQGFFRVLIFLFSRLKDDVQKGFVPYYFIPEVNLIKGIPGNLLKDALKILDAVTMNVSKYIPAETETVHNWLEKTSNVFHEIIDIIETTRVYGYAALFTYQNRLTANLKHFLITNS